LTYSPAFSRAVAVVLEHEKGFVNDPVDSGGATNWGISLRWLKGMGDLDKDGWLDGDLDHDGDIDVDDIRIMTPERASMFYFNSFWAPFNYQRINEPAVSTKIFDLAVNMGSVTAHKRLQEALNLCACGLKVDGVIGPNTIRAINDVPMWRLLRNYREQVASFYINLINANSAREKYRNGWLNRAYF